MTPQDLRARKSNIVHTYTNEEEMVEACMRSTGALAMLFAVNYTLEKLAQELENDLQTN